MEETRTCPFKKATERDIVLFQNVDIDAEMLKECIKSGDKAAMKLSTKDGESYVGLAIGRCDGEHCALWNKTGRCCTFVSMAWSLRQLITVVGERKGGGRE